MDDLLGVTQFKKQLVLVPTEVIDNASVTVAAGPLPAVRWKADWLGLGQTLGRCYESVRTAVLFCPEDPISLQFFPTAGWCDLSTPSS